MINVLRVSDDQEGSLRAAISRRPVRSSGLPQSEDYTPGRSKVINEEAERQREFFSRRQRQRGQLMCAPAVESLDDFLSDRDSGWELRVGWGGEPAWDLLDLANPPNPYLSRNWRRAPLAGPISRAGGKTNNGRQDARQQVQAPEACPSHPISEPQHAPEEAIRRYQVQKSR
jgi:hypothetical protein